MNSVDQIRRSFNERYPIKKEELKKLLDIENENSFNQKLSYLVKFDILKRYINGVYYIPSNDSRFFELKPSLRDVLDKMYLESYSGIISGAKPLYKYKLTSQVSSYYEIITNNVSSNTRHKRMFDKKVIVSHSKFNINKDNYKYAEFLEIVNNINLSDGIEAKYDEV